MPRYYNYDSSGRAIKTYLDQGEPPQDAASDAFGAAQTTAQEQSATTQQNTADKDGPADDAGFPNGERYDGSKPGFAGADGDDSGLLIWTNQDPATNPNGQNTVAGTTAGVPGDTGSNPTKGEETFEFDPDRDLDTLVGPSGEDELPDGDALLTVEDEFIFTPDTTGSVLMSEDAVANAAVLLTGLGQSVNQFGAPPPIAGSFDVPLPDDQQIATDDYSPLELI